MQQGTSGGCGSGSGQCGCAGKATAEAAVKSEPVAALPRSIAQKIDFHAVASASPIAAPSGHDAPARVNGIAIHAVGDRPDDSTLRQRAYGELLRQEAVRTGLLPKEDVATDDGIQSEAATQAIEKLIESELLIPAPDEETSRRFFEANPTRFQDGERVRARHILFAVTLGMDVVRLRNRAEAALLDARCRDDKAVDRFAALAKELSNCPSAVDGGDLGWLTNGECAAEFAREIFGRSEVGVLPRLVHSRFGLHVVEVIARQPGETPSFEDVRGAVSQVLQQKTYVTALRQYLQLIAGGAHIEGIELDAAQSPLVQ